MKKLTVGRVRLNESEFRTLDEKPSDNGGRIVSTSGVEIRPLITKEALRALSANINGMAGIMVPVVFGSKSEWDGYYTVRGCSATVTDWDEEGVGLLEWEFELDLVGHANDIDIQSRLSGPPALLNDFSGAGERWHAPPIGHTAYWSGPSQPAQIIRQTVDGPMRVYVPIDPDTSPRFHCPVGEYGKGRVRFIDSDNIERSGQSMNVEPTDWTLTNAMLRVQEIPEGIMVSAWDDGWRGKIWQISRDGVALGRPTAVTVLHNEYEMVVIRCLWNLVSGGRCQADLTLRRGSRFVEVYFKSMLQGVIAIKLASTEAGFAGTGFVRADADDSDGNRYVIGSAKTFDADTAVGGISKSATRVLDAFIGAAIGGSGATGAETEDRLLQQYLGAPAERILGVRL